MSKKIKPAYILEIIWLITFVLCAGAAIYKTSKEGFYESILFYLLSFVSLLMYLMRRYMRKNRAQ